MNMNTNFNVHQLLQTFAQPISKASNFIASKISNRTMPPVPANSTATENKLIETPQQEQKTNFMMKAVSLLVKLLPAGPPGFTVVGGKEEETAVGGKEEESAPDLTMDPEIRQKYNDIEKEKKTTEAERDGRQEPPSADIAAMRKFHSESQVFNLKLKELDSALDLVKDKMLSHPALGSLYEKQHKASQNSIDGRLNANKKNINTLKKAISTREAIILGENDYKQYGDLAKMQYAGKTVTSEESVLAENFAEKLNADSELTSLKANLASEKTIESQLTAEKTDLDAYKKTPKKIKNDINNFVSKLQEIKDAQGLAQLLADTKLEVFTTNTSFILGSNMNTAVQLYKTMQNPVMGDLLSECEQLCDDKNILDKLSLLKAHDQGLANAFPLLISQLLDS
jgi:hypothetical protein